MAQEIISDADMQRLVALGRAKPGPSSAMPDVLSDEQMNVLSTQSSAQPENERLKKAQALRYPTSAEQGGPRVQAVQSSFNIPEIATGVGQSLANTGLAALQWGQNVAGMPVTPTPPSFEPKNIGQQVGRSIGHVATSAAPAIATGGAPLAAQVAAGGLGMGLAAAGAGEDPQAASTLGMAFPVGARVLGTVAKAIPRKIAQAANEWMGVHPTWMEHGANPGARLAEERILGGTREEVKQQIDDRLKETGREIQARLLRADQSGNTYDAEDAVITALDNATKRIGLRTDEAFQKQLDNVLTDSLREFPNLRNMTLTELHALKSRISDSIKWTGAPYEADLNKALLGIYRSTNDIVKSNVPGIAETLSKYADMKVAQNALSKSILQEATTTGMTRGLGGAITGSLVKPVAKAAGAAGLLGAGAYELKRLRGY